MNKYDRVADKLSRRGRRGSAPEPGRKKRRYSSPHNEDYVRAGRLKEELLEEYRDSDLLAETDFKVEETEYGKTLHSEEVVEKELSTPSTTTRDLLCDLKLVYGIGEVRERELKEEGYRTVGDLRDHPRWGEKATSIEEVFREGDLKRAYSVMRRWKPLSHPAFLRFSGLFEPEGFAIVDIETMGLSNQPIFLLGLARPKGSGIVIHQFLARDLDQELASLVRFADYLEEREIVLTYNGKNFDMPYIERRLGYYGQRKRFSHPHLDLYLFSKKMLADRTRNCKLGTIERSILGIERDLDVPSAMVPDFYSSFREKGNPGPLMPVLAHHRQDLLSLADLYERLVRESLNENI